jgi:hypothetical protein
MRKSDLSKEFLLAMVCAMYTYEAHEVKDINLLSDSEMQDFYDSYMGVSL